MPDAERFSEEEARNVGDFLIAMVLLERTIRDRLCGYLAASDRFDHLSKFVSRKPISDFVDRIGWTTPDDVADLRKELRELLQVRNRIAHHLPSDAVVLPPLEPGETLDPVKLFGEGKAIRYWEYDGEEEVFTAVDLHRFTERAVSATSRVRELAGPD